MIIGNFEVETNEGKKRKQVFYHYNQN